MSNNVSFSTTLVRYVEENLKPQNEDSKAKWLGKVVTRAFADTACAAVALIETLVLGILTALLSVVKLFNSKEKIFTNYKNTTADAFSAMKNATKGIFGFNSYESTSSLGKMVKAVGEKITPYATFKNAGYVSGAVFGLGASVLAYKNSETVLSYLNELSKLFTSNMVEENL